MFERISSGASFPNSKILIFKSMKKRPGGGKKRYQDLAKHNIYQNDPIKPSRELETD